MFPFFSLVTMSCPFVDASSAVLTSWAPRTHLTLDCQALEWYKCYIWQEEVNNLRVKETEYDKKIPTVD